MNRENLAECKLVGQTEILGENLPQCRLVHKKSHMTCHGIERKPPQKEPGD
jgi:hypothetical protein